MLKNCRPLRQVAAAVLLFALPLTAIGQQSPQTAPTPASASTQASTPAPETASAPAPTPQMIKVMKSLSRYEEGTKLDLRLNDGSHQIGKVSETWPTYFVIVESASGKARTIHYIDVAGVRPTGKEYVAHQVHRGLTEPGLVIGAVVVFAVLGVLALLAFHK